MTSPSLIHRPLVFLPREKIDVSAFLIYFPKSIKSKLHKGKERENKKEKK